MYPHGPPSHPRKAFTPSHLEYSIAQRIHTDLRLIREKLSGLPTWNTQSHNVSTRTSVSSAKSFHAFPPGILNRTTYPHGPPSHPRKAFTPSHLEYSIAQRIHTDLRLIREKLSRLPTWNTQSHNVSTRTSVSSAKSFHAFPPTSNTSPICQECFNEIFPTIKLAHALHHVRFDLVERASMWDLSRQRKSANCPPWSTSDTSCSVSPRDTSERRKSQRAHLLLQCVQVSQVGMLQVEQNPTVMRRRGNSCSKLCVPFQRLL